MFTKFWTWWLVERNRSAIWQLVLLIAAILGVALMGYLLFEIAQQIISLGIKPMREA